jgi:hypothetical protein
MDEHLVTIYPTGTTQSQTGLDTFYKNVICPSGLSAQGCATNQSNLDTPEFGNFDLASKPIANNPLGIKLVDAIKIDYTAVNVNGTPVTVSGGLAVPEIPPGSIKGLVLYFHGTTVQRNNVPSAFTSTTSSYYTNGILLAALWASQGYIVVMPDYIGLGDDTTNAHPYVAYPRVNAQSGLAMVLAVREILSQVYGISGTLPMFVTGYSEGGAYSLEAAHLMQDNSGYAKQLNVQFKEAVPLSGFFDLTGTGLPYLFDNLSPVDFNNRWYSLTPAESIASKPFLSAYLALSFAHYSGIPATQILAKGFYQSCPASKTPCGNLDDIYFNDTQFPDYDDVVLVDAGAQAVNAGWSAKATNYSNAITPLLTPQYADALQQKDTSNPLYKQLSEADTYRFTPNFPVVLLSLEQDSVVTRRNTDVAYSYFQQQNPKGSYQEILVPNAEFLAPGILSDAEVDHLTELPFLGVLILNEFNTAK